MLYFKATPIESWGFESFKTFKTRNCRITPNEKTLTANYNKCLEELLHLNDLTEEIKEKVAKLKTDLNEPQETEEKNKGGNTYNNYGVVLAQGEGNRVSINNSRQRDEGSVIEGPSTKRLNVGEENEDEDPRSDLSNDYQPTRRSEYILEEVVYEHTKDSIAEDEENWIVQGFNVSESLHKLQQISLTIPARASSDMRLLSINHIYLFNPVRSGSVTRYMDIYNHTKLIVGRNLYYVFKGQVPSSVRASMT